MKQINITIHPFSALAGMALLGLVFVTAGAMPMQGSSSTRDVSAIKNVNDPHPRDFVDFDGSQPFVVPANHLLVITAVGYATQISTPSGGQTGLAVDGLPKVLIAVSEGAGRGGFTSIVQLPGKGYVAFPGQTVTTLPGGDVHAWGYLVDA